MTVFQMIAVPLAALLFLRSGVRFVRGDGHRWVAILSMALWLAAGIAIAQPGLTNTVARFFGIGRGADLVSYFIALAFLASVVYFYHKYRKLNSDVTEIIRRLAIQNATKETPEARDDGVDVQATGTQSTDRAPTA
jgi:hypothetical protein